MSPLYPKLRSESCEISQNQQVTISPNTGEIISSIIISVYPFLNTIMKELLLFSRSVVSNSLRPHGLQHTRLPCPSPSLGVCSNSCPLSWWCHPIISSSVIPFSSCLQSFPASGSFPMSQLFIHIGWPKYWSFSLSISPSNEHSGLISFRIVWFDLLAVQEAAESETLGETVGGQSEALGPWQRSWGRRLDIRKGGIEPHESPWKSSSIYPHNQSLPTLLLCALTYSSDFLGGCPPPPLLEKELT